MKQRIISFVLLASVYSGCVSTKSELARHGLVKPQAIDLVETSFDPTYGYTQDNPIMVGGYFEGSSHRNQYIYLEQLAGPNGESIQTRRVGNCCPFKAPGAYKDIGLLDRWEIRIDGSEGVVLLYLNSYGYVDPKAPMGFSPAKAHREPVKARE